MAVLFVEGFQSYGAVGTTGSTLENRLKQRWTRVNTTYLTDSKINSGRTGTALDWVNQTGKYLVKSFRDSQTIIVGFALWPAQAGELLDLRAASTEHLTLKITSAGNLSVYRGTQLIATSSGGPVRLNDWHYIEVKASIHNSSGSVEIRVNGTAVAMAQNVDTAAGSDLFVNNVIFRSRTDTRLDDIYILDTQSSPNDFLGPNVFVQTIRPNADGDLSDWTPSSGTDHYGLVDEEAPDESDYVSTSTIDAEDLYHYTNLSTIDETIHALQLVNVAEVTGGSHCILETICKPGSTVRQIGQFGIVDSNPETHWLISSTNPETGSAWTPSEVNASQFGEKLVS